MARASGWTRFARIVRVFCVTRFAVRGLRLVRVIRVARVDLLHDVMVVVRFFAFVVAAAACAVVVRTGARLGRSWVVAKLGVLRRTVW